MKPAFFLILMLMLSTLSYGQSVPSLINYQGRLTGQNGDTPPMGSYGIEFRLWDSPTNTTGLIWGQQQNVGVQANGVFHVILGAAGGSTLANPVPAVNDLGFAFGGATRFLGVTVVAINGSPVSGASEILPRQQLLSVPFAILSRQVVDGAITSQQIAPATITSNQIADGAVTSSKLTQDIITRLVPPGTIMAFGGNEAVIPFGWTLCDGAELNRMVHSNLWAAIGTNHGAGNGSTTFNVPDLRGVFLRGVDLSSARGATGRDPDASTRLTSKPGGNGGNSVGSFQTHQLASHTHAAWRSETGYFGGGADWPIVDPTSGNTPNTSVNNAVLPTGGSETRPVNVYVNYIIKN